MSAPRRLLPAAAACLALGACATDQRFDTGLDRGPLDQKLVWGLYVDPDGCDVWLVDDGLEGYAVPRIDPETGARICSGTLPPGTAQGHRRGFDPF